MSELCICDFDAAVVYNSKSLIVNKAEIEHACPWSTTYRLFSSYPFRGFLTPY
jgi:hypothetical protein